MSEASPLEPSIGKLAVGEGINVAVGVLVTVGVDVGGTKVGVLVGGTGVKVFVGSAGVDVFVGRTAETIGESKNILPISAIMNKKIKKNTSLDFLFIV